MNVAISGVKSLVMQKNVKYEIEIVSLKASCHRNHPHFEVKTNHKHTNTKMLLIRAVLIKAFNTWTCGV